MHERTSPHMHAIACAHTHTSTHKNAQYANASTPAQAHFVKSSDKSDCNYKEQFMQIKFFLATII